MLVYNNNRFYQINKAETVVEEANKFSVFAQLVYKFIMADSSLLDDENMNINRKLNVFKHIKKKAANDAQLLM